MNWKGYNPYDHALQWPHVTKADMRNVQPLAEVMRDQNRRATAQRARARRLDRMVPVILAGLLARSGVVAHDCGEWRGAAGMALHIAKNGRRDRPDNGVVETTRRAPRSGGNAGTVLAGKRVKYGKKSG